jgi:acyl-[acyl-carrier-protein]-phospholipid O-acyltransferase/long-chain-fatty-acid--[acyl-carrier-protein] ligase
MAQQRSLTNDEGRLAGVRPLGLLASLHRWFIRFLLFRMHGIEVDGIETLQRLASDRRPLVLIANHVSHFDGVMWGCFLPRPLILTINSHDSRRGYPGWLVRNHRVAIMDARTAQSLRMLVRIVRGGATCLVFPEGRVTRTGELHKVNPGAAILADLAGANLVPAWVDGPQLTRFSYLRGRVRRRLFPPIRFTFLPPRECAIAAGVTGSRRRAAMAAALEDMLEEARMRATCRPLTVFEQFQDICKRVVVPSAGAIEEDVERKVTFASLLKATRMAAVAFGSLARPGRFVGLVPEATADGVAAILGLQAAGLPTLVLDASIDPAGLAEACRTAQVELVFADRSTLSAGHLRELAASGVRVVPCEEVLHPVDRDGDRRIRRKPDGVARDPRAPSLGFIRHDPAGRPEIVVVSHANILANRAQAEARMSLVCGETVFSSAPLHHPQGLLGGVLMPLLSGCKTVLRAHPLSPGGMPASLSVACASVLVLDPVFYRAWLASSDPLDASYVRRLLVTGPVDAPSRIACLDKLGVRPWPVLADVRATCFVAAPRASEPDDGGYGRPLPGLCVQPAVDGVRIAGDNVALGVMRAGAPGIIEAFSPDGIVLAHARAAHSACAAPHRCLVDAAAAMDHGGTATSSTPPVGAPNTTSGSNGARLATN